MNTTGTASAASCSARSENWPDGTTMSRRSVVPSPKITMSDCWIQARGFGCR